VLIGVLKINKPWVFEYLIKMHIGTKIRMRRKELGMSVQSLSEKINMTRQNIYNLENQEHIHTKTLSQLGEVLEVDLLWFFSENSYDYLHNKSMLQKEHLKKRIKDLELTQEILNRELNELKDVIKKV
jgi:transcriptional regulator with XRE-family HTH domain